MSTTTVRVAVVALLVLLAGCAGGMGDGGPDDALPTAAGSGDDAPTTATDGTTAGGADGASTTPGDDGGETDGKSVNFYVSDEPNAIDRFAHLNVTITRVGFERAPGDGGGGWVEYPVENRTVDLTELRGANATRIASFDVPDGSYRKVFAHVGEVDATLAGGEEVRVKLPSEKLQIEKEFAVGNGSTDFVFDIAVHEAGGSGKYVLRPVISESGTDVAIESVGEDDRGADRDGERGERGDRDGPRVALVGDVTPGENATVAVTRNGTAVANAAVAVNGERAGTTNANGTVSVAVPNATELTVRVSADGSTIERTFEPSAEGENGDR